MYYLISSSILNQLLSLQNNSFCESSGSCGAPWKGTPQLWASQRKR